VSYNTKFDIIIPCYNVEHIIEKSIESVLSQEYPKDKFSIIAINDGSTDNTLKCLNTFSFEKNLTLFR
jgi:Glycosyltransferases, probably involved in cell wall biogenesis